MSEKSQKQSKNQLKRAKYCIKSPYGYYRGMTNSFDSPICWIKGPRMSTKFTSKKVIKEAIKALELIYGYNDLEIDEFKPVVGGN